MTGMTMRQRILAVVQGREHDRVPFVMYDGILPKDEVQRALGRDRAGGSRVGFMRWCRIHRLVAPHCRIESEDYVVGETPWQRNTLHTPRGSIYEERAYEPVYGSSNVRKHYVEEPADYDVFWAYLEDITVVEDMARFYEDAADLGEDGYPLAAVERTPYQQLWVQWTGLDNLGYHLADCPDRVARTVDLLHAQARETFEIAYRSPAAFIDFPDNITAPTIGPRRFREYCLPLYAELADMLDERGAVVYVHMDGDLKPLWEAIADSRVGGLDSFAPAPDNDTSVAEAVALWPDKRLWVNFPSSVHLQPVDRVRAQADEILAAAGHTGRLQIQISENVPPGVWRTSLPSIVEAIEGFGAP